MKIGGTNEVIGNDISYFFFFYCCYNNSKNNIVSVRIINEEAKSRAAFSLVHQFTNRPTSRDVRTTPE